MRKYPTGGQNSHTVLLQVNYSWLFDVSAVFAEHCQGEENKKLESPDERSIITLTTTRVLVQRKI